MKLQTLACKSPSALISSCEALALISSCEASPSTPVFKLVL
jgi:hypothetical protein